MEFRKVAIIGVGEIGGSIGLCLRKKHLAKEVVGIGRRPSSLRKAKKVGACDKVILVRKLHEGVKDADLIILATPVLKIVKLANLAARYAKERAIMTDVGSTKKHIVEQLERTLPKEIKFVGSHPMAGSEKGGPLSAKSDLFDGRDCFITKTKKVDKGTLGRIKKFWKDLGARPIVISLSEHDRIVANISQMIHIVASGLVIAAKKDLRYAASGFKDTTRIALAAPELWEDICITNNKNISTSLNELINILKVFKKAVSTKNVTAIHSMLKKARELRREL